MDKADIVAIIGAGAMGNGIAQVAATYGHQVIVYDNSAISLDKARKQMQSVMEMLVDKGKISIEDQTEILSRLTYTSNLDNVKNAKLVIEAIIENLEIKQDIFRKIEELVSEDTILASNTSSLSITSIASACENTGRVLGIHFFNPAPVMKLVEVIPALQTENSIFEKAYNWMKAWGKTAVKAKDTPGFIVNRVARPYYSEALRILDEGIATKEEIDTAMTQEAGFRMGPFELMDFIGQDVNFKVTESTYNAFYQEPRYKPSITQKKLVEAGWLGRKTGKGFYNYGDHAPKTHVELDDNLAQRISNRVVVMLINEAYDALYYKIASAEDIDLAMTLGVNYPKGLIAWGKEVGIPKVIKKMESLYSNYEEDRYRCSMGLKKEK